MFYQEHIMQWAIQETAHEVSNLDTISGRGKSLIRKSLLFQSRGGKSQIKEKLNKIEK